MSIDVEPLFALLRVRGLELANRIVMAPMTRNFSPGGVPGVDVAAYYRRRAEGGTGLLITEGVGIDHPAALGDAGLGESNLPHLFGAEALAGWKRVVDAVHGAGGKVIPQLWHQGVMRDPQTGPHPGVPSLRPSGVWGPASPNNSLDAGYVARMQPATPAMSDSDVQDVIDAYARSARHARAIGCDGVAIHGAHGYLIDTFLWDETNRRTDRWGGNHRQRAEFGAEIVRAIRREIGPGKPIMFRFSQHKQQDYWAKLGQTPNELGEILNALADAGVDILDASIRGFDTPAFEGSDLNLAGWAKKLTGKITSTVGGIGLSNRLEQMFAGEETQALNNLDRVLERFNNGEFDLILVGRGMLADPAWSERVRAGEGLAPFDKSALTRLA
jgi:2,4-dienoyl-CoA reductase-like NADH-dependent reductase (Old Yellow Enzyme family)